MVQICISARFFQKEPYLACLKIHINSLKDNALLPASSLLSRVDRFKFNKTFRIITQEIFKSSKILLFRVVIARPHPSNHI